MGTKGRLGDAENAEHPVEMPTLRKRLMRSVATESVHVARRRLCPSLYPHG